VHRDSAYGDSDTAAVAARLSCSEQLQVDDHDRVSPSQPARALKAARLHTTRMMMLQGLNLFCAARRQGHPEPGPATRGVTGDREDKAGPQPGPPAAKYPCRAPAPGRARKVTNSSHWPESLALRRNSSSQARVTGPKVSLRVSLALLANRQIWPAVLKSRPGLGGRKQEF
jgi:hypothetical protein